MLERIRSLLPSNKTGSESLIESGGFVYATETEATSLQDVGVGSTVRNADAGPPWIVVNHSLAAVLVSRWPGRLLRVEILEKAKEQPLPSANYTRAVAVQVLEELPACSLFGEHNAPLVEILDRIITLTLDDALALSAALEPSSSETYSFAWKNWLAKVEGNSVFRDDNHEDTLQVRVRCDVSPIGYALSLVSSMVLNRGRAVSGAAAITVDPEGEVELQAPWSGASSALLHAAMAYGAPDLLTQQQAAALKSPWQSLMRAPTGG
jgi:hypothetical protein